MADKLTNMQQQKDLDALEKPMLRQQRRAQFRLFPIWMRIVLICLLLFLATTIGLWIGYSVMGDGDASDTFNIKTWKHIVDMMNGK